MTQQPFLRKLWAVLKSPERRVDLMRWTWAKLISGKPPAVNLPEGHLAYPADRFNDYASIAAQRPDRSEFDLLNRLLGVGRDKAFVDVGANVGLMSILAHSTGKISRIVAVEPVPRLVTAFRRNMMLNGIPSATIFQGALADTNSRAWFDANPNTPLNGQLSDVPIPIHGIEVSAKTLDDLCDEQGLAIVDLLKIDVEGSELRVLQGGRKLLESRRIRAILFEFIVEFLEASKSSPDSLITLLDQTGYNIYGINADGTIGKQCDVETIVNERRVSANAPLRPFNEINLIALARS